MKNNKSSQSSIEYLITYTIAILIVVLILTVLINIIFKPAPQQTLPSICNINPSFQCAGAMLVNSTSTTPAIYYLEFTNKMSEPILLSSSALNLTSLGTSSSISVKGNCYPSFVASGGEVICKVLLNSTTVPSTGTKTTSNFALSYHICSNLSTSSCSQTTYTTSGSSIQTVGPSKTTFYSVAINIEGVNSIGAVVSTNGSVLINGVPYINGQNALITKAGNYKIYATPPNGFNFTSWSLTSPNSLLSSTTSQSTTITINSNSTLTAKFTKIVVISYYNLNVFANLSVGGIVAPSSNRYKEGSIVTLSALANNGYYFTNWIGSGSGSYSGTSNTPTITINNNINETATFKPFNPVYVTFNSESNPTMQDTGSATILDVAGILFTLSNFPKTIIFAHNSIITYKFESPIAGASSTQYVFNYIAPDSGCTTDGLTQQSGSFTASSNCIANANYTTQYYLTTSSYPSSEGTASPSSEWVNYENTVALSATPDSGYVFTGWQCTGNGCYNGNNAIDTLTIDNPITETATFNIPLAVSISPSSATLDQGQSITIDSSPSGGKPPYSYQWYEQAPASNVEPAVNCQSSTSQDCTFATNTAIAAGIYTYYIAVTDQMDNTIDSSNSVITLNPPLSVSISPTSATYDSGQTITLAASVSGGTPSYSYQWYNDSSGSGVAISGATYSTYSVSAGATGTFKYYVVVTDSATTPTSAQSSTGTYTVNPALSVSISPTSATYDSGQTMTLTSSVSGGTSPYTYQWYNDSSGSGVAISGATSSSLSVPTSLCSFGNTLSITLTNSQSSATPAPFQQMINLTESNFGNCLQYNNNFADFEYTYTNGTVIPAWIESNQSGKLITWLNLKNGIPANSNVIIDLKFEPNTNLLSSSGTTGIGEAPQLPSTYAEYDDGVSVFTNYWNFAGTSLPSGFNSLASGGTYSVSNGLTLSTPATADDYIHVFTTSQYAPAIEESYVSSFTNLNDGEYDIAYTPVETGAGGDLGYYTAYRFSNYDDNTINKERLVEDVAGKGLAITRAKFTALSSFIISGFWPATGNEYMQINYANTLSTIDANITHANSNLDLFLFTVNPTAITTTITWLRTRAYPPSGEMPSVIFGSQQVFKYYIVATDSATTKASAQSSTGTYTVNPALAVSISPTSATYNSGQTQTISFTSTVLGGTSPYTYQWYNDSSGNAVAISGATSSSLSVPASLCSFGNPLSITLTNSQSSATPAPFQQMINLTESNFGNCLQYNNNFADFEYTYTNGTVIPAWIESNQSGKLITWLNLKNGIPANSNVIIDLKFEPNTNLLSSSGTTGIGEAAQLSSTYAEYDNIANVMQPGLIYQVYYDPTGTCDNTNYQDNISASFLEKEFTIFSCTFFISYTNPFTTNQIGTTQDVNGNSQPNVVLNYQEGYSGGAAYPNPPVSNNAYSWIIKTIGWADLPNQKVTFYGLSDDGIAMGYNTITGLSNGQYWLSGTSNPNNIYTFPADIVATEYNGIVSPGTYAIEQDYFENGGGAYTALWSNATVNYYHASYPPNGAMPSVSFGSDSYQSFKYYVVAKDSATTPTSVQSSTGTYTVNPALTVSISPIYVTLDSGQDLTFTSSVSGGIPPYSYQWYGVSNGTATAISGETSSSITFTAPSATTTYKYYVYVVVTDSATTPTSVQSPTGAYTTEPALSVSISPTSATYDSGQTMTLTSSVSGGIPPYSYQWYNDTSGTATAISGATSSTYSVSAGATGTFKYYVVAKDSATTPTSAQSSTGTYTVNPALSVSISPTSETYNAGPKPVISIISTVSGGTSPYTYQWYNDSSGSGVAISGATSNVINISTGEVKNREVNIIITNSQSSATPAPFQQLLAINSSFFSYDYSVEAGNLQNIYFTYTNGTIIPSWLEAGVLANGLIISSYGNASLLNQSVNTKYWLNLKNGIPANSAITIEMHFASKSTNEFNNQNIGEAPQLSSTYAEYDDGGDVFNFYSNFRGNTLNTSKWTIYGAPSITIDNGLTLAATSGSWMGIYNSISYNPQLYVNDFYAYFTGLDSSNGGPTKTIGWEPGGLAEPSYNLGDASTTDYTLWNYNGAGAATTIAGGTTSTYQIWNLWATSAASYLSLNYGTPVSSSTDFTASTSSEIGIGGAVNTGNSIKVQWFRLRAYPPSGVMPSISFEPYIVNYYVVAKDSATTPTSAQSSTGTYTVNINNAQPQ
jgi:hypothetical protein